MTAMTDQTARARLVAYLQQAGLSTARAEANIQALLDEQPAAVPVPPPADQTALRELIAAAARTVRLRLGPNAVAMAQRGEPIILNLNESDDLADAVLAVLPEQTDRAAAGAELDELRSSWETLARWSREDAAALIELGRLVGVAPVGDRIVSVRAAVEAIGTALRRVAAEEQPTEAREAQHLGGRANAEDCPACKGTNPPYPFLCPGPDAR